MKRRIIFCALLTTAFLLLPTITRARDYSANIGRFMTMDVYEGNQFAPQTLHKYIYCANNPVNRVDPSGHDGDLGSLAVAGGISGTIDALELPAISISYVRATAVATTIALTLTSDESDRIILYHYSQSPPPSFAAGLFPPAWVTPVSGLDSKTAMFDLSINPPLYEYTFRINRYMLGPPNNFNPGRVVQYPVETPTGPGSMLKWKYVLQTHGM